MPSFARRRSPLALVACSIVLAFLARGAVAADPEPPALRFLRDGAAVRTLTLEQLRACCEPREVAVDDPYYGVPKRFHAFPLAAVLARGFGDTRSERFASAELLLRARDGYTRTASGAQLLSSGGYLAFADADHPQGAFFPIDRRQVDPAPFYLVWEGAEQRDTNLWPWPYQLVEIEVADFAAKFPHVPPPGAAPGKPAQRGFTLFRRYCIACHSMNGEGGKVGPELNVPRSIVEYREPVQLKRFIRDARSFRYTSMPAQPQLTDADLDALVAYFEHMRAHKHDPGPGAGH
jgi:mono/diheme cytochrome c family protein